MKGGLAAIWGAMLILHDLGLEPKRSLSLTLTPDEESGGESGVGHLLREGMVRTEDIAFLIMPECTSGDVWNASKGALVVDVIVSGKPAHSTLPHLGRNAFEDMLPVAEELVELRRTVEKRREPGLRSKTRARPSRRWPLGVKAAVERSSTSFPAGTTSPSTVAPSGGIAGRGARRAFRRPRSHACAGHRRGVWDLVGGEPVADGA